jgi:hypothetical protein
MRAQAFLAQYYCCNSQSQLFHHLQWIAPQFLINNPLNNVRCLRGPPTRNSETGQLLKFIRFIYSESEPLIAECLPIEKEGIINWDQEPIYVPLEELEICDCALDHYQWLQNETINHC